MHKSLPLIAALVVLATSTANAQQREAVFQKIEVANVAFDVILATAKPNSPALYLQDQPDPNVLYLPAGLVAAYTPELAAILDVEMLLRPAHVTITGDKQSATPIVVYIVPKRIAPASTVMR